MRFKFDSAEKITDKENGGTLVLSPSSITPPPKEEFEWVPLQNHPLFSGRSSSSSSGIVPENLLAWDGASRMYFWDSDNRCLHRISIRLAEPDPKSIIAACPSKVMQVDIELDFVVNRISINRNGSSLLLVGSNGLCVMYLYGRPSPKDSAIICRTVPIGSKQYYNTKEGMRILKVSWHPYSDTHLGILSPDSVFRLFDLSTNLELPEQAYYLQPFNLGRERKASSICPVDFSFGGDHLWDRFSVFVLFSDGSVYTLCPVVPFGSLHKWESILEIYSDAHTFGAKSASPKAVSNSDAAISWLESSFPELARHAAEGRNKLELKAHPYARLDASITLQGPLRKLCHGEEEGSDIRASECEGRAISFLYNSVSKDSILVTAWSGGHLQIDALGDEIQPVWSFGNRPHISVDSYDNIVGIAMSCESVSSELPVVMFDQLPDHNDWLGHPPPLLRLAIVDLALPKRDETGRISMFVDPLMPERIYALHNRGIDSIILHFLPFTSHTSGKDDTMRTPSVQPVLSTCQGESSSLSPLCGFVSLADSFGYSWIVGVTSAFECVVLEMETWNLLLSSHLKEKTFTSPDEPEVKRDTSIISKELLRGPKMILVPPSSTNPVAADSIEGRSTIHQYFKLFHENYVEYAHKVYFELKHHGSQLKESIDQQHANLHETSQKLFNVEQKQEELEKRIDHAIQTHGLLQERLLNLRSLPGIHKKPLSKAEREFKMELDRFRGMELDALHTSIETITARLKRLSSLQSKRPEQQKQISGRRKDLVQEDAMSDLKAAIAKLSLVNSENAQKVKLVDSALRSRESIS